MKTQAILLLGLFLAVLVLSFSLSSSTNAGDKHTSSSVKKIFSFRK